MSAELKKRGFRYLGPVVVYSHMQAAGMVNDHEQNCFLCGKTE
jgi:DNA-3-methyladenine glycosylase I